MKTFEQQTADAIRNLNLLCAILAIGLLVGIGVAAWGLVEASNASNAANAGLVKQTSNRASNVLLWCHSIDKIESQLSGYVKRFRHAPALQLSHLDCNRIAAATERSTQPAVQTAPAGRS